MASPRSSVHPKSNAPPSRLDASPPSPASLDRLGRHLARASASSCSREHRAARGCVDRNAQRPVGSDQPPLLHSNETNERRRSCMHRASPRNRCSCADTTRANRLPPSPLHRPVLLDPRRRAPALTPSMGPDQPAQGALDEPAQPDLAQHRQIWPSTDLDSSVPFRPGSAASLQPNRRLHLSVPNRSIPGPTRPVSREFRLRLGV